VVKGGSLPLNVNTLNGIDKIEGKQSNRHFTINEGDSAGVAAPLR
jgi:hypothetical protein